MRSSCSSTSSPIFVWMAPTPKASASPARIVVCAVPLAPNMMGLSALKASPACRHVSSEENRSPLSRASRAFASRPAKATGRLFGAERRNTGPSCSCCSIRNWSGSDNKSHVFPNRGIPLASGIDFEPDPVDIGQTPLSKFKSSGATLRSARVAGASGVHSRACPPRCSE